MRRKILLITRSCVEGASLWRAGGHLLHIISVEMIVSSGLGRMQEGSGRDVGGDLLGRSMSAVGFRLASGKRRQDMCAIVEVQKGWMWCKATGGSPRSSGM